MRKGTYILLSAVVAVGLAGCASKKKDEVAECNFPGSSTKAPGWVCDEPVAGVPVSAVGTAEKSDAGLSFMKQMAATQARVQLAQQMKVQVQNMIKQFVETTGGASSETVDRVNGSVTRQITDQSLVGTKILKSANAPNGAVYVLVGLDEASTQKIAETAIRTSMNNEKAAWQQFRAKKNFDEMAEEIAKQKVEAGKK